MKKLWPYLLFALFLPTIISSCKKDKIVEPELAGEQWFFTKAIHEEFDSAGVLIDTKTDQNFTANDYLYLQDDGQFELIQWNQRVTGTYTIIDSILSLTYLQRTSPNTSAEVTLNADVVEKTAALFTFIVEQADISGSLRSTIYLRRYAPVSIQPEPAFMNKIRTGLARPSIPRHVDNGGSLWIRQLSWRS